MPVSSLSVGILIFASTVSLLVWQFVRAPKRVRIPPWGWVGLGIILLSEAFLFAGHKWIGIYFTPLAWTGYLLLIDAATWSLRGQSRLGSTPREFLKLAFWSVPLWLIFEAYNLRLQNWTYVGLPANPLLQAIGYVWSFATIWPAILGTAEFVVALGWFESLHVRRIVLRPSTHLSIVMLGIALVAVPALVPIHIGRYLFGAVWVGFVLLFDPLNYFARRRSLLGDLEEGRRGTLYSLLISGLICGVLWEFWNYWATAKWLYVFPIMQDWKMFEMPLAGYLGFPPFALECFVLYEFLGTLRHPVHSMGADRK